MMYILYDLIINFLFDFSNTTKTLGVKPMKTNKNIIKEGTDIAPVIM